ncbi:hypothetical protein [Bradyrhizobium sp. NAS96.2]|uniref:hypothetical protein n=1 Tax=Bradyrhizobium sp. NAS96.2 TaxID=1680160 RepID=UPI001160E7F7|nr:hypothetical protein [Bradyrhizobium sp. NAS96.2]
MKARFNLGRVDRQLNLPDEISATQYTLPEKLCRRRAGVIAVENQFIKLPNARQKICESFRPTSNCDAIHYYLLVRRAVKKDFERYPARFGAALNSARIKILCLKPFRRGKACTLLPQKREQVP